MNMNYDKWLSVVVDQILQLVRHSPTVDSIDNSVQPSVAVSVDNNPSYKNAVLIAMVEDDGLFDVKDFEWIFGFTLTNGIFPKRKMASLESLILNLNDYAKHFELINSAIENCPEEFLDSLMDTIMQDPVILPSGNRCDRSSIVRQLSISPIDPFTRSPLTIDMVRPDTELRNRIHEYIKLRIEELQKQE